MTEQIAQTLDSILSTLRCILVVLVLIAFSIPGKTSIREAVDEALSKLRGKL